MSESRVVQLKAAEPLPPEVNQNIVDRLKVLLSLAEKGEVHSLLLMYERGDSNLATETIGVGCTGHLMQYISQLEVTKLDMTLAILDSSETIEPDDDAS